MAKKNKHRFLKFTLLSVLSYRSGKYVFAHPHILNDLKQTFKDTMNSLQEFSKAVTNLQSSTTKLQDAVKASRPTFEAIQKDVEHFQYKLQPRLTKINELTQDIDNQINKISTDNTKK